MVESTPSLEDLARRAVDGDRTAVHSLVCAVQNDIHGLALRMLWNRADAEDATQEILVRVITRLSQFDFQSRLKTWVYRVATNYLLDVKKSPLERMKLTFAGFAEDLADGQSSDGPTDVERSLLTEEVRIGCTLAMLQCLDRPHRLAYILGEIFELSTPEAAQAVGVAAATFRKRLQRARERVETFTREHCGLVSPTATCQCNARVSKAVQVGRIDVNALAFARVPTSFEEIRTLVRGVDATRRTLELYRGSHLSEVDFARRVVSALEAIDVTA